MKVTLEIDEKYATVLTVSAVGYNEASIDVSIHAADIRKFNHIILDKSGTWTDKVIEDNA